MRSRLALLAVLLAGCSMSTGTTTTTQTPTTTTTVAATTTTSPPLPIFSVRSPAFDNGSGIPPLYTCDGLDLSPELDIVGLPEGTQSIAIIVEDPDAPLGTWYHWVAFDIPTADESLVIPEDAVDVGTEALNSWHLEGYMGPCPPQGGDHTYLFVVYALSSELGLPSGVNAGTVLDAMGPILIDSTRMSGTYGR